MVLEDYCGYNAWNLEIFWNSDRLIVPPCLNDTSTLWFASAFILVLAPYQIFKARSKPNSELPWTALIVTKLTIGFVLIGSSLYELVAELVKLNGHQVIYPNAYCTPLIQLLTYTLAILLSQSNRLKGIHTSGISFVFWLLMVIYSAISYSTVIKSLKNENQQVWTFGRTDLVIESLQTFGAIFEFLAHFWPDKQKKGLKEKSTENECPYADSSFISSILFSWFDSMAFKGFKKTLTQPDMWPVLEENQTETVKSRFQPKFASSVHLSHGTDSKLESKIRVSILRALMKTFWPTLIFSTFCKMVSSLLVFASPQLMDTLLTTIISDQPSWKGYLIVLTMFIASLLQSIASSQYEFWIKVSSMRMRTAVIATVYQKSLRLSSLGKSDFTSGEIVNLMAVDTQRIVDYVNIVNYLWVAPYQLVITIYLLWQQLGVSSLAGLVGMIALVPLNGLVAKWYESIQSGLMEQKDSRMKLISEILSGMKVLKLYAWEGAFGTIIKSIRKKEINALKRQALCGSGFEWAFQSAPFFIAMMTFITYLLIDQSHVLDAKKAFVSISLIYVLSGPLAFLPMVVTHGATFLVSIHRINKYLEGDELDTSSISHNQDQTAPITLRDASFSWSPRGQPVLKDVDLNVTDKQLIAIVGSVGSGKSSFLSALLGDLYKQKGYVNVYGTIGYVPQSAWIQNASIRDNITFGSHFDREKYDRVIAACALKADFAILTGGDLTEIGERGINLSGGQKQRISIARAVYANSDIYFLDDPLSAVDSHVAKQLFDRVIGPKGLLRNKTRLLVTHRLTFLPRVDQIIFLRDGQIVEMGTYNDLIYKEGAFSDLINQCATEQKEDLKSPNIDTNFKTKIQLSRSLSMSSSDASLGLLNHRRSVRSFEELQVNSLELKEDVDIDKFKLVEEETSETGSVKWTVYFEYFSAIGWKSCTFGFLLFTIANGLNFCTNLWLAAWSDDAQDQVKLNDTSLRNQRLIVYSILGISESIFVLLNSIVIYSAVVVGAQWIHTKMLDQLIRAPMSLFDTTPIGRILNRFSKDIDIADTEIGFNIYNLMYTTFKSVVIILSLCLASAYLVIVIVVTGFIYILIQKIYITTTRQLRRIEAVSRSPIYSHFSETVSGSTSIRAYGAEKRFNVELNRRTDINQSSFFTNIVADRWLEIRLDLLGNIIVTSTALFAIISRAYVSPGIVGLSISYALQIIQILNMLVREVSGIENNIVSIERCLQYTKVPTEAPWIISSHRPEKDWPREGKISFEKYSTRYRPGLDLVLKDIGCTINPNEKVGIVGRTGAGKSSLTLALFRLIEPSSGTIIIDDEDITKLGLHDLRSRLTVIPQDPVLFSGSLRRNFDPFNIHTDDEIWLALEQSNLKNFVIKLQDQLEYEISEAGENLSVGQRQLVCLARALLRKSKVLILDEATAAVDIETDQLIQQTIREQFKNCTIVTIAHRLDTIMDYDKIVVMDKGQLVEFDTPNNLLNNPKSLFHSMAKDAKLI